VTGGRCQRFRGNAERLEGDISVLEVTPSDWRAMSAFFRGNAERLEGDISFLEVTPSDLKTMSTF
jgi:hypothetical protein